MEVSPVLNLSRSSSPFVLALDVGSSSCRAGLYDALGRRVDGVGSQLTYLPAVTADGGAELDTELLLEAVSGSIDRAAAQAGPAFPAVGAVAISTFWHSLVGVDAAGRAATPVYLWMDARSRGAAEELRRRMDEASVHSRTGCLLHWGYLPAKLLWLSQRDPDLFRQVSHWMSFGEYLILRFFGRTFASISMASATGLFNQHSCEWDGEVLAHLPLDVDKLPSLGSLESQFVGLQPEHASRWPALREVPWLPALGDGACSNLGAGCATRERFALMVGTSGALRALWTADEVEIPRGLWCYRADRRRPVLGGALNDGGSLVAWLRRTLQLPALDDLEPLVAAMQPDAHGLTLLPFWAGERSPGWASDATGAVVGMRLHTGPADILRAALEAVALRFALLDALLRQEVPEVREVVATGGALLRSPAWMQIMADVLGRPVLASSESEASLRGAALAALESLGLLSQRIETMAPPVARSYEPVEGHTERYRAAAERQARLYEALIGPGPRGVE
jgi:gluconokinase